MEQSFTRVGQVIEGMDAEDWVEHFQEEHADESAETFYEWLNK